jgi:hypothetical protein
VQPHLTISDLKSGIFLREDLGVMCRQNFRNQNWMLLYNAYRGSLRRTTLSLFPTKPVWVIEFFPTNTSGLKYCVGECPPRNPGLRRLRVAQNASQDFHGIPAPFQPMEQPILQVKQTAIERLSRSRGT